MDQNVMLEDAFANPCCITWKQKCSKLEKRQANLEKGRSALKECLKIYEHQVSKLEADNDALKKECEGEKAKSDNEREQKEREYAMRAALENELNALKIECQMVQHDGNSSSEDSKGEVQRLEKRISEGEEEIKRLKELVENEKLRANEEKKRADAEKKRAVSEEKKAKDALKKVTEDKKLTDLERKHYDENKVQLEALKTELEERISEGEEEIKRLKELVENEKLRANEEKKRADAEKKRAVSEGKKAKDALKKVTEDKKLTDLERKHYDENKVQLEALKIELGQIKVNLEETVKQLEIEKSRADSVEERAESERKKADEALKKLKENNGVINDESKSSEEYRTQLEVLKAEIVQVKLNFEETKQQLDKEKSRADAEKKRADAEKKRAESVRKKANEAEKKVKEDTRRADVERKKSEESSAQLNVLKAEIVQVKADLEETKKQLGKEKITSDAEKKISESERKKAKEAEKKVKIDNRLADVERKKSEESIAQLEVLKTEIIQVKAVLEETEKQFEKEKARVDAEKKRADAEKLRADSERKKCIEAVKKMKEDNRLADVEKRKSKENTSQLEVLKTGTVRRKTDQQKSGNAYKQPTDKKHLVEQLHQDVDNNKQRIQEMQSVIENLLTSKNLLTSPLPIKNSESENSKIKLLRKKLKFEKMLVKHANQVAELEVARNNILHYEVGRLKQEILKFSEHLNILDNPALRSDAGIASHGKLCIPSLKRKHSHEQPHPVNLFSSEELMRPCSTGNASHSKYSVKCSAPLPEGCSGETLSGINSKLERLHRGLNQKMSQSSAINSCSASFSDRPLVGSQEDGAFPITTSNNLAEEKSNSEQFPFRFTDGLTTSFIHHSHTIATQKNNGDDNKNKELPLPVESTRKTCQAVIDNLSNPSLPEEGSLIPVLQGNGCIEGIRSSKRRKKISEHMVPEGALRNSSTESDKSKQAPKSRSSPAASNGLWKDGVNDFLLNPELSGSCNGLKLCNIMKLLDLDNEEDERSFCAAMERPMSPSLPVLELKSLNTVNVRGCKDFLDNNFHGGKSNLHDNASKCGSFDIIEVEIDSNNNLKSSVVGISTRQLQMSNDVICAIRNFDGFEKADISQKTDLKFCKDGESSQPMSDTVTIGRESLDLHKSDVPLTCSSLPRYVIVSPEIKDAVSISRIFRAVGRMSHCSTISSSNYIKESLIILAGDEGLSSKEKVCTFITSMLQKIHEDVIRNPERAIGSDYCQFIDTFSCNLNAVFSDIKMKNIMLDLWDLCDLLYIVEDFLTNRRALLFDDASSNSIRTSSLDGNGGIPCTQEAPISLLVAGGALLATISASIDDIGFVCDVACNILRTQKSNSSLVLIILRVFARICGPKFFGEEYGLVVDVIRSLVVHLERLNSSYNTASCFPSLVEAPSKPWSCCQCPFLDDASSIDEAMSRLLKELHNYIINFTEKRNHLDSINLPESRAKMYEMDYFKDDQVRVCENFDVFSLLELVSSFMSWDWSFENIVCPVFKMLESCAMECVSAAVITLLGQLGRLGVEAHGYDDAKIENLRNRFSDFLSRSATGNSGFLAQLASAIALSSLLPLSFENLVSCDSMIPPAAVSLKNWFFSLSDEQQSSCKIELFNNLE